MTPAFNIAVEELYEVFGKYPLWAPIDGCPCCVSESDKSTLHAKPLRELTDEDLSRYAFKAMTTWGDVNDFKHYLPRIFELAATRKLVVNTFVILGKLDYGNWQDWQAIEQDSILRFLKAWWKYDINNGPYFDTEVLNELHKRIQDLESMLNDWELQVDSQGFKNYVDLIEFNHLEIIGKNSSLKDLNNDELIQLLNWIHANSSKLEEGFFEYESKDEAFSQSISNALFMLEQVWNK